MTTCFNKKWNYILFKLDRILEETNDKLLKVMIRLMKNISPELKDSVCSQYVKACKFIHSIAIMEWRGLVKKNS